MDGVIEYEYLMASSAQTNGLAYAASISLFQSFNMRKANNEGLIVSGLQCLRRVIIYGFRLCGSHKAKGRDVVR